MNKALIDQAMQLNASEKLALIEVLYHSLDKPDPEVDRAWLEVATQRQASVMRGEAKLIPAAEVFGKYQ